MNLMRIAYVWAYGGWPFDYWLTNADGHFETFAYMARYYDVQVFVPSNFAGQFDRDGYVVHGRTSVEDTLDLLRDRGRPWDAVVCYGPYGETAWERVRRDAGTGVVCLDYAGGPLCDLNGGPHSAAHIFDHVFTAHETQAAFLRGLGVAATKARGVPTNRYRPIPGVPKLWHVICPNTFVPGKRNPLVAQYCEQYAPHKPSLFLGAMENPAIVDMVRAGGLPLNKPGIQHRNGIELGQRAPYAVMPLLYNASEVCIVGSQEEAGPWVALEAMACGVPTIVMADCAWLVSEAFSEFSEFYPGVRVVAPEPTAIHEAVESLLENYAEHSASARRAIVRHYDWWSQYQAVDSTLKRLVGLRAAGQENAAVRR